VLIEDPADLSHVLRPGIGSSALKWARHAEESLKGLFLPGLLFEELGFKYVGPLPGHQIESLIETFRNIKQLPGPILVHVLTTKGKGYPLLRRTR
jgi:1-deoxy-D-xylulose-5-phosphate synthase